MEAERSPAEEEVTALSRCLSQHIHVPQSEAPSASRLQSPYEVHATGQGGEITGCW